MPDDSSPNEVQTIWVIPDSDDSPPLYAFLDKGLADRWSTALGLYGPDAVGLVVDEPDRQTWYRSHAVYRSSVHIPTGERSTEVSQVITQVERWGHQSHDAHMFPTSEAAEAHATTCDICGTP